MSARPNHGLPPELQGRLDELRHDGPRRFSRWDASLFEALAAGPFLALSEAIDGQADAGPVLAAYLALLHQSVGCAGVRRASAGPGGWATYLERCLVEQVPALLPSVPAGKRLPILVKAWNLCEGLLREPGWLDRFVCASASGLGGLEELEGFLVRTLEPVLSAAPPAAWQGPFTVTVLDLRPVHEEFLPGEITLAAPAVLRVTDRHHAGIEIGILLRAGGNSKPLGLLSGLGEFTDTNQTPIVEFRDGLVRVGSQEVAVPHLRSCHSHLAVRSGFVAACAVDSQRLWVLETP
jgi:hypothetical protein